MCIVPVILYNYKHNKHKNPSECHHGCKHLLLKHILAYRFLVDCFVINILEQPSPVKLFFTLTRLKLSRPYLTIAG